MEEKSTMTLVEHLVELRRRLIRALLAFALCTVLSLALLHDLMKQILVAPLETLNPRTTNIIAKANPMVRLLQPYIAKDFKGAPVRLYAQAFKEKLVVKLKMAFLAGLVLGSPFILYQVWAFIGAGLVAKERRVIRRYLPMSVLLFLFGVGFCYFVVLPPTLLFLASIDPEIELLAMVGLYFGFVVMLLTVFGLAFQMPLVAMFLARVGLVPARVLARRRGYAIVLIFLVAAILTPPDAFTQCLLAVPMILLYEVGIWLARAVERVRGRG